MRMRETIETEVENTYCDDCATELRTHENGWVEGLEHWPPNSSVTGIPENALGQRAEVCEVCYKKLKAEWEEYLKPYKEELEKASARKIQEIYYRIMGIGKPADAEKEKGETMSVRELIAELFKHPLDRLVLVSGYESGYNRANVIIPVNVQKLKPQPYFEGEYGDSDEEDGGAWNAEEGAAVIPAVYIGSERGNY
jgi:hypothetical protein